MNNSFEDLRQLFNDFKKTDAYSQRLAQLRFVEIAQLILKELLKKEVISNVHLTSLIHLFGYRVTKVTFTRHLHNLDFQVDIENEILDKFVKSGQTGFTGVGRFAIHDLDESQLVSVRELLVAVSNAKSIEEVIRAADNYQSNNIPLVTWGIYSPWLHYLQPKICPLLTGNVIPFIKKRGLEVNKKYGEMIEIFQQLKSQLHEDNLGIIDSFIWHLGIIGPPPQEWISDYFGLLNNKKQIIMFGPPGTGKTYKTKSIALSFLGEYGNKEANENKESKNSQERRVWIFQANPNRYDLVGALSDQGYKKTSWDIAQYKNQIKQGDIVLLWLSGKKSGIYAVAEITSNPALEIDSFEDVKYWKTNEPRIERLAVRITIIDNLVKNPVFKEELKDIRELKELSIFGFSQATNFPVRAEEWKILQQKISEHQ